MKKYLLLLVVLLGSVCAYSQNKMVEAIHLKKWKCYKRGYYRADTRQANYYSHF